MINRSRRKILFLYIAEKDEISLGVGFLSSYIQSMGWDTDLIVWNIIPGPDPASANMTPLDAVLNEIQKRAPACLCISVMSLNMPYIDKLLSRLNQFYEGPVLVGGYHAIAAPEDFLEYQAVDGVVIGDGERPLSSFLECVESGGDAYGIKGLWGKRGRFFSDDWRGEHWYVERLDDYPYIDYELFHRLKPINKRENVFFSPMKQTLSIMPAVSGRGCPYRCTYCSNAVRMSKYPNVKSYLRKYEPALFVSHLEEYVRRYEIQFLDFLDELFIHDRDWIASFVLEYKKRINLPFSAQVHLSYLDEEICKLMRDCGWMLAAFGLECGDEEYRRTYLRRQMSNEFIKRQVEVLKKNGIFTVSYNMMGMPFETERTLSATIDLNKEIQPDLAMHFYWQPLPGTELTKMAIKEGLIPEFHARDMNTICNFGSPSILNNSEIVKKYYSEFAQMPFSLQSRAQDRLMSKLHEAATEWLNKRA